VEGRRGFSLQHTLPVGYCFESSQEAQSAERGDKKNELRLKHARSTITLIVGDLGILGPLGKRPCTIAMDIKSIIDSEDTPPTRKPSVPVPPNQEYRPSPTGFPKTQAPAYDNRRDARPPQPSPLQTPSHNGTHFNTASPNDNLRSPYRRTSPYGLNKGQYPSAQAPNVSPHHVQQVPYYTTREINSANGPPSGRSFGQITPLSQTPTASTPGSTSAYSTFQRPTSSHSIPTPNSTQHSSSILRESPQPLNTSSRPLSQPRGGQQHASQPGTPLGPPSTYHRQSLNTHWESPGAYSHQSSLSGGPASQNEIQNLSAVSRGSPPVYREPRSSIQEHRGSRERERSLSVSPKTRLHSPPNTNRVESTEGPQDPSVRWSGQITPAKRRTEPEISESGRSSEPKLTRTPSRLVGLSGLLNAEPSSETSERVFRPSQTKSPSNKEQDSDVEVLDYVPLKRPSQNHSSSLSGPASQHSHDHSMSHSTKPSQISTPKTSGSMTSAQNFASTRPDQAVSDSLPKLLSQPEMISSFKQAALKTSNGLINAPLPQGQKSSRGKKQAKRPMQEPSETEAPDTDDPVHSRPAKKKPRLEQLQHIAEPASTQEPLSQPKRSHVHRVSRYEDVPIFAQSVRGPQRTKDLFESNRNGVRQGPASAIHAPYVAVAAAAAAESHRQGNGILASNNQSQPTNGIAVSNTQVALTSNGLMGPWEYNIANVEPLDEVIRLVSDFLFLNVVMDDKVGVAPAGGGRGLGAIFEIEAKIGRIIDNNTNDRIRLPVESECVLSRSDPSIKTRFESSMTEVSLHPIFPLFSGTNQVTLHSNNISPSTSF